MTSHHRKCPVCRRPLSWELRDLTAVGLWCAYGPCPSDAANKGATGENEATAYARLVALIEAEQEQLPGGPAKAPRI